MGLDIGLGLVILVAGIRGWFRGFVLQGIRLAALVGCVYAAAPIRDLARPYAAEYLKSVKPELLDRLLWWSAAVIGYTTAVGLASLAVKMRRRRPFGETEPNRADQFAGFLLGGAKGVLVAAFLVAGVQKYAIGWLKGVDWAQEQVKESYAMEWDAKFHPAERVWSSPPVQHYVAQIKRLGMAGPGTEPDPAPGSAEPKAIQAAVAAAPPKLEVENPGATSVDPRSSDFARDFDRIFEELSREKPQDD